MSPKPTASQRKAKSPLVRGIIATLIVCLLVAVYVQGQAIRNRRAPTNSIATKHSQRTDEPPVSAGPVQEEEPAPSVVIAAKREAPQSRAYQALNEELLLSQHKIALVPHPNGKILQFDKPSLNGSPVASSLKNPFSTEGPTVWHLCSGDATSKGILTRFFAGHMHRALVEDYLPELRANGHYFELAAPSDSCHIAITSQRLSAFQGGNTFNEHFRYLDAVKVGDADSEKNHEKAKESYSLCLSSFEKVEISAISEIGLMNALRTMLQISLQRVPSEPYPSICILGDEPKYAWRGQHLDTARHFHGIETVKGIIRHMSRLKMNRFHWHLSDDQGWRLESFAFPSLHLIGGRRGPSQNGFKFKKYGGEEYKAPKYHTQQDVRDIIVFAAARGIMVVPEIDFPAHAAAMVAGLQREAGDVGKSFGSLVAVNTGNDDCKELPGSREGAPNCMGGTFAVMNPTKAAVAVCTKMLKEICSLFLESEYFHLGGDEAEFIRDGLWRSIKCDLEGCSSVDASKQQDFSAVQAVLTDALIAFIRSGECAGPKNGKRKTPIVWDESIVELRKGTVPDAVGMLWRDDRVTLQQIEKQYQAAGVPLESARIVLTPKTRVYMDYLQHAEVGKNRYWPLQQPAPWMKYKAVTLERAFMTHTMVSPVVYGVEGCMWTELIPNATVLEYQMFPRLYAVADSGWTQRGEESSGSKKSVEQVVKQQFPLFARKVQRVDELCASPKL